VQNPLCNEPIAVLGKEDSCRQQPNPTGVDHETHRRLNYIS
jgi:hypothetical protein